MTTKPAAHFTRYRLDAVPGRYFRGPGGGFVAWRYRYRSEGVLPDGRAYQTDWPNKAECRAWAKRVGMVATFSTDAPKPLKSQLEVVPK